MTRLSMGVAVVALAFGISAGTALATPGVPKPNNVAAKICQAEKHADKADFQATYADEGKHAMRNCKRAHRGEAKAIVAEASQECRDEQDADPVLFQTTYGTNGNGHGNGGGKNAFGKCVSGKVHEAIAATA